jgi:hypothetical protein
VATIDQHGIALASQGDQQDHPWTGFSHIYESRQVLMLEERDGRFIYLPKRVMGPAQLDQFNNFASFATNCKVRLTSIREIP